MKQSAYDILGVPANASRDELTAAYEQQRAKLDPTLPQNRADPDAEVRAKILQEAFSLVDDPVRRQAYDASLTRSAVPYYPEADLRAVEVSRMKMVLIGLLFLATVGGGLFYLYDNKKKELAQERERILQAEQEAARRAAETDEDYAYGYDDAESRQRRQELKIQREMEAARREGERVSRQLQYEEEAARQQAEWERQRQEGEARDEQRRAEREAANRRYQSQREYRPSTYEPPRGVAVVPPTSPSQPEER
jgi:colicin import membrane protein